MNKTPIHRIPTKLIPAQTSTWINNLFFHGNIEYFEPLPRYLHIFFQQSMWTFDNNVKPSTPIKMAHYKWLSHKMCTYLFKILHRLAIYNQHQFVHMYVYLSSAFAKWKFQNSMRNSIVIEMDVEKRVRCHLKLKMSIVVKILQFQTNFQVEKNSHFDQRLFAAWNWKKKQTEARVRYD